MQLTDLRFWHWIVIGALLGLLIGYSLNAIGPDALIAGAKVSKLGQMTFEQELLAPPETGANGQALPYIDNLVVYPDGPIDLLKFQRLVLPSNLEKNVDFLYRHGVFPWLASDPNQTKMIVETWYYDAHRPYSPLNPSLRTEVWVKPDIRADGYEGDDNWDQNDGAGKGWRDPGTAGMTLLNLQLAKGNYNVVINLNNPKEAADLSLKFDGHPLPPLTVDPTDSQYFHTTISAAFFDGADNARQLWMARTDTPIHVGKIHIFNPNYTVRDYLNQMAAEKAPNGSLQYPQIRYTYGWWVEPRAILWMSLCGAILVVGIIWPIVLNQMVGAGFGPPPREKGVSLRGLKATAAPVAGGRLPTDDELASVDSMADALAEDLEDGASPARPGAAPAAPGPAPIRPLVAKPLEPAPQPVARNDDKPKTFVGEYYPVARKVVGEDEKKEE